MTDAEDQIVARSTSAAGFAIWLRKAAAFGVVGANTFRWRRSDREIFGAEATPLPVDTDPATSSQHRANRRRLGFLQITRRPACWLLHVIPDATARHPQVPADDGLAAWERDD